MALIGMEIADFTADAYHNDKFIKVSKQDLIGGWTVLFFYPADFTYVCPTELGDLADHYSQFQEIGCRVLAVSCDTHFVHKAWHSASQTVSRVDFPMLADPTGKIARSFQVLDEEAGLAMRGSFVINPHGQIVAYEVHADGVGRDAAGLLRKVQAAKFVEEHDGVVCPAKWQPGQETIKPSLDLVGKL